MNVEPKIVYSKEEFDDFAGFCDNADTVTKQTHFPLAVKIIENRSRQIARMVAPPYDYSSPQKSIYLLGVLEGMQT